MFDRPLVALVAGVGILVSLQVSAARGGPEPTSTDAGHVESTDAGHVESTDAGH